MLTIPYFLMSVIFASIFVVFSIVLIMNRKPWRWMAIILPMVGCCLAFDGFDRFLGQPKPVDAVSGWHNPNMGGRGATVLGGEFNNELVTLMLREDGAPSPRLYAFRADPVLVTMLKAAMEKHAQANFGEHWGFVMKPAGGGNGAGKASVQGNTPDGRGPASLLFEEPHAATSHQKDPIPGSP